MERIRDWNFVRSTDLRRTATVRATTDDVWDLMMALLDHVA
jgi:hypothetical protein